MSQLASGREAIEKKAILSLYGPVQDELHQVEELLRAELRSEHPFVDELVKHGFRLGGKRLRPALLLLAAKAVGQTNDQHIVLAAVVEMIHTATLIHDDVLDEAEIRRHFDTVNARWNNESSVLLGDYLFTHAFYLASTLDTVFACRTIGRSTNLVCEGELRQVHNCGNLDLTETEYLQIIDAKTAELTACSCLLGAHYAGADETATGRLSRFGRSLGIAFQIVDDLLDLVGEEATTGKSLGTDMEKQKATLPLIRALELATVEDRAAILSIVETPGDHPRSALREALQRVGAIDYARAKARDYATAALEELSWFESNPALEILRGLTEFVVARQQ